jgi:N12 class adenine-specific DNA methylase/predicted kinase/predicted RNA methylase
MPIVDYRGKQVTFPDDITESEINIAMGSIADQIDADLLAESNQPKPGLLTALKDRYSPDKDLEKYTPKEEIALTREEKTNLDFKTAEDLGNVVKRKGKFGTEISDEISPAEIQVIESELAKTDDPAIKGVLNEQLTRPKSKRDNKTLTERETLYTANQPQKLSDKELLSAPRDVEANFDNIASGVMDALPQGFEATKQGIRSQFADAIDNEAMSADAQLKALRNRNAMDASTPDFESATAAGIYSGATSLIQQVPGLAAAIATGNPLPALAAAGLMTEAEAYTRYRERGATPQEAITGAMGEGAVEVLTELTPMRFLVDKFGKVGAAKFVGGFIAKDALPEQVATLAQDAIDTAIANPNKTWGEYLQERPGAAYQTLLATVVQAGTMGAANTIAKRLSAKPSLADDISIQQAQADTALQNITNPDISVDDAIELAQVATESPMVSEAIMSAVLPGNQASEAIPASDILGDENVSDTDTIAALVDGNVIESSDNTIGSSTDTLQGNGSADDGSLALAPNGTLSASNGQDNTVRTGSDKPDGALSIEQVNEDSNGTPFAKNVPIVGEAIDQEWTAFNPETGTLGIPRSEMPQIKAEHRGPMVNFLNARGIQQTQETIPAASLKPTQQEFSAAKVQKAIDFVGGNRSILVSADNHILDGHHQWLAKLNAGEDIDVIRLDAPIAELIDTVKEFPSATLDDGAESKVNLNGIQPDSKQILNSKKTATANPLFEKNRDLIESLAPRMNWGTIGNKRIDDEKGNQIGRSKYEPIDQAMDELRVKSGLSYAAMRNAVDKALKGSPLSKAEQRTIDLIADYAEANPDLNDAPIDAEQAARLQSEYDNEPAGSFDELVYGIDTPTDKVAVTELSDEALLVGAGRIMSYEEVEALFNSVGVQDEQKTNSERIETQVGSNEPRGTPAGETENVSPENQPEAVKPQANSQVRPIVEAITKRRAAASQIGKEKQFDTYLALAKKLMNGEAVKPANFKLAATTLKADATLADLFTQLFEIAQTPAKEARTEKTNTIEAYKQRIAAAKTADALQTIAGEIQRDSALSDNQAATLDDAVFEAQDALEPDEPKSADLLGDNTAAKQAVADAERAKDAKRNTGNSDTEGFTLSGSNSEADKAAASGAQDLFSQPETKPKQFADNKVFTVDKVEAARARLKSKLGTLNSGIDPELLIDGMTIAGAYIESGVRSFSDYAKAMTNDFGDSIKPYLLSFYEAARAYPDIEKEGMTSADNAAKEHHALLTPAVKAEVSLVIGNGVVEAKKVKAKPDGQITLTQDWGVDDINGYDSELDNGKGGEVKTQFLAEAKKYLTQVAKLLEADGFAAHTDQKGRTQKAVSVNEGGMAGSGEVTLTMLKGDVGLYIDIGTSAIRGLTGNHPQAVSVMVRVTGKAKTDRFATSGQNNWLRSDLNTTSLAEKMLALAASVKPAGNPAFAIPANVQKAIDQAKRMPSTHTIDTPERIALRKKIADDLYGTGAKNKKRKMDIVMGLPASGKSSSVAEPLAKEHGALIIDSDDAKKQLPEFGGGIGAGAVHLESSAIAKNLLVKAIQNGDNLVYPTVGKDYTFLNELIDRAEQNGYQVTVHFVDVPVEVAFKRAIERFNRSNRLVNPQNIIDIGLLPSTNFDKIQVDRKNNGYAKYSNDVEQGQGPVTLYAREPRGNDSRLGNGKHDVEGSARSVRGNRSESEESLSNARANQTGQLFSESTQSDSVTELSGRSNRQSLDDGLASESASPDQQQRVSGRVSDPSGNGTQSTSGTAARVESSGATREDADAGNQPGPTNDGKTDFEITADVELGKGSAAQKYQDNINAIKLIKTLESENRQATPDERKQLAKYVGFGALSSVFEKKHVNYAELKELLTEEEYSSARASILNAYYTSAILVNSMYDAVARLGFKGGRILEPSLGSGNFFGLMPASLRNKSQLNGVELDSITSRLAKHLYPNANVATSTGFETYQAPNGYFDLVVSNPPFGSEKIRDNDKTPYSGFSIHNYFIAKSIDKLRDGGVMAVVVSHNFMDTQNSVAREWIAERATLLGAVRLPSDAFKENAGTEVITDILYFQKTASPETSPDWIEVTDSNGYTFNNYFLGNPRNVLGRIKDTTNQYGATFTIESTGDIKTKLSEFNKSLPEAVYSESTERIELLDSADATVPDGVKVGTFYKDEKGDIRQRTPDVLGLKRSVSLELPNEKAKERMLGMMALRDLLRDQMRLEREPDATIKEIERNRERLNSRYDEYLKKYGYLNSATNRRLFLDDTESALLQALEFNYDQGVSKLKAESTGQEEKPASATKADIFRQRVLFPPSDAITVNSAKDALLAALDVKGSVDIDYMAEVYDKPTAEIIDELGEVIYNDPNRGYVTADEYLSGDVKTKLVEAKSYAKTNPDFNRNVSALEKIIPKDKVPSEIYASAGANWIPADVYAAFASEITGIPIGNLEFRYISAAAIWLSEKSNNGDIGKMTSDFGTEKINAYELFHLLINGKAPDVKKSVMMGGERRQETDVEGTELARTKYEKIKETWNSWIFKDPDRADKLASIYNEKHNRIVARKYDGSHMHLYGASPLITLRQHQKDVVWRAVQSRNVLLDHVVGAGKTMAMASMAMEMKRLGIARKPLFVVPNHLTLQWRTEFTMLYPAANILAATPDDFAKDKREKMFSKMVTGGYDAIIIGHSSLTKVGLPAEIEEKMYNEQVEEISAAIEVAKSDRGDRGITRDMEKIKANLEAKIARLKEKAGTKDNVVTFDELGIDALFVDEMHEFKNLFFTTQMQRTAGLGNPSGSGKALDMFMKIKWMQDTFGEDVPLVTATGTPVSNSLAEMYTMQRYMKYKQMKREGLHMFDAWAKQFGEVEQVYEVAPSGVGYRQSTRFSKFKNLPALMSSYGSFADIITMQDLKEQTAAHTDPITGKPKVFPVPKLKTGKPMNVIAPRSQLQTDFFGVPKLDTDEKGNIKFELDIDTAKIEQNADGVFTVNKSGNFESLDKAELHLVTQALQPKTFIDPESLLGKFANLAQLTRESKGKINALSLTGLANKCGLDYRIIDPGAPDFEGSKINIAVKNMVELWQETTKDKGTQIVFCDLSIPNSARNEIGNKERRVYVRDNSGQLTHKAKGVVYAAPDMEGYPFYLVKQGTKYMVYEAVSGQEMYTYNVTDKASAKAWVDNFVQAESNHDRIFALRDARSIDQAAIDEYRDAKELDLAEDGSNEISLADLEAVAGSSQFSVYDDIKTKLLKAGVPEVQIAFIHDYNTPKKKEDLFKRINQGEVRFVLGSTPKLGAGTNIQKRLVGLHHIDAPWRPSDLEQREGRIIRQGNELYARDPDGFEVSVWRYATEQTYDTRRWQLLEHKAAGIDQLRKYTGETEIEDVVSEASNSADMKAAASGNPLILEETKLRTETKRLINLEKAHQDSIYNMARTIKSNEAGINERWPNRIAGIRDQIKALNNYPIPTDKAKVAETVVDDKKTTNRETAENDIALLATRVRQSFDTKEAKVIKYRGVEFTFERGVKLGEVKLNSPDGLMHYYVEKDLVSPSGLITRFNNYIDSFAEKIEYTQALIEKAKIENESLKQRVGGGFESADLLKQTQAKHAQVQRKLIKSTQLESIPEDQRDDFKRLVEQRKEKLNSLGYDKALREAQREEDDNDIKFSRNDPFFSLGTGTKLQLTKSKSQFGAKMLNTALVKYFGADWSNSFESVDVPDTLLAYKQEIKTAFGKELRYVSPTSEKFDIFAGVQLPNSPNSIYVNARAETNLTTIAGHELYHALERSRPDLHNWFKKEAEKYIQDFGAYHENLNKKLQEGEKPYKTDTAMSELLADFTGDALSDAKFLQELANANSSKFKELLNVTIRFLNQSILKLKNLGSSVYISDVETLRNSLKKALLAFSNGTPIAETAAEQTGGNDDIRFSRQGRLMPQWDAPESSTMDSIVYALQDKHVDLKRVTQAIKKTTGDISDRWNAYLQEELYHGRTAKRTQDFIKTQLEPLIEEMRMRGVAMADFEEYLWMRHAEERNIQIAKVNPDMQDGGSGVSTAEANTYLNGLSPALKAKYQALAKRIDAINRKSRQVLLDYGLESSDTVAAWESAYKNYVPLMREDMDAAFGNGTGQGFSVKGNASRRATGSSRAVVDIIANIAQQYEKNIIRGEKNRVATALIGLAKLNPNDGFWQVDTPPTITTINKITKQVETRIDPSYKSRDNVVVARIPDKLGKIQERSVVFNQFDERAMRMATSIKNLDQDQIGELLGAASVATRWFASINTQYNPIFGVINILRDTQGAALNLSSTPLKGKQKQVLAKVPSALKGIYLDVRNVRKTGNQAANKWSALFEEFGIEGGQTGYRDMFRNARERGKALEHALDPSWWKNTKIGKVISVNGTIAPAQQWMYDKTVKYIFDWLSDYNLALENAVRLATYQVALDSGLSKQQGASLAKNISVNFNRKGEMGRQMGSLYAFFNASVQGTARIGETLLETKNGKLKLSKTGAKIVAGGLLLGVMQALALAMAGYDEDEPPAFVRDRNLIIPLDWLGADGKYISIAMPLGFNAIPNLGRIITEWALAGGDNTGERVVHIIDMFLNVTNPLGNAGISMQTVAPTVFDPLVALAENKDFTGKPIAREDFNSLKPTPGFTRAKDTASVLSKALSEALNSLTGGTDYTKGALSPTPDQIDYLAGQLTGGVGREYLKLEQTATAALTGEDLPVYKIPLFGRFYGDASTGSSQGGAFYKNIQRMNEHESEMQGRRENGESVADYKNDNPDVVLINQAKLSYKMVTKLRKRQREMIERDAAPEQVQVIGEKITRQMARFNMLVKARKEQAAQ